MKTTKVGLVRISGGPMSEVDPIRSKPSVSSNTFRLATQTRGANT